ncbi:aminopeptidase, partial [Acidovorax sp. HMWF018]|uniref:P1 family peptidase n=1 Tax=Acidovorax sp. HMWF018 TaxID=2056855 RepID=UPI000D43D825
PKWAAQEATKSKKWRLPRSRGKFRGLVQRSPNDVITPLFQAAMEATQEAIYNAMLKAQTMTGSGGRTLQALPLDKVKEVLQQHGIKPKR